MRVLGVVGNRPQFVKSSSLSLALRAAGIEEVVVHTGQHYDPELSQVFFDELGIAAPAVELDLRTADVAEMQVSIADEVASRQPDWVLVYGDTNSTLAGARAAAACGVRLAHVEAGLRSGDLTMPEERNRIEVDRTADLLLCPDERSAGVLAAERVRGQVEIVGDVMYDVCLRFAPVARRRSRTLAELGLRPGGYVLATIHREANVQPERLRRIIAGLARLDEPVLLAAHPRTAAAIRSAGLTLGHVRICPPFSYLDFSALASQARVIVTDSGGVQKEAYWYGVPCVTARPSTEWVDTVSVGANVLVDDDPDRLVAAVGGARMPAERPPLYGDGRASERVAAALLGSLAAS
ncbi:MAG TPA: UDP-N-acetylglucosamine 2-epimerase (non-hydrolyzing) [Gaiellaceae bacterium]|nr:UDP-N-acetylglucosamine 2-epimerase (non-hydrolyzing) [Gaiellaceae bacterium]